MITIPTSYLISEWRSVRVYPSANDKSFILRWYFPALRVRAIDLRNREKRRSRCFNTYSIRVLPRFLLYTEDGQFGGGDGSGAGKTEGERWLLGVSFVTGFFLKGAERVHDLNNISGKGMNTAYSWWLGWLCDDITFSSCVPNLNRQSSEPCHNTTMADVMNGI